ncbi:MAG: lamin tail domain-containing protein, partial [Gammaproteobacteria bacterium]
MYPHLAAPSFSQHGATFSNQFTLTISAPVGTIYYTTNGSDPRLEGGGIAPSAFAYSTPITLTASRNVRARAFHTNAWSALNEATFIEATPIPLRITEFMFNPFVDETSTNESEAFEYVEVRNTGSLPLALAGMKFARGITFDFPNVVLGPSQYAVIVKNTAAFQSRYGTGINVLGKYAGSLSDNGENIRLLGALGERIDDFEYRDWFVLTDGLGFSMTLNTEERDRDSLSEPEAWRVSGVFNGTPGFPDTPSNMPRIVINEVLTHTDPPAIDAIELYNPSSAPADIGGWFLTDEARDPMKFRIPTGTTIG